MGEEVLGWQPKVQDFRDTHFMGQSLLLAEELATSSANHPSVLIFGFFNEGASHDGSVATRNAYSAMVKILKTISRGTRLVSWGSIAGTSDQHLSLADVASFHDYT